MTAKKTTKKAGGGRTTPKKAAGDGSSRANGAARPSTIAEILAAKKAPRIRVQLVLDGELVDAREERRGELNAASLLAGRTDEDGSFAAALKRKRAEFEAAETAVAEQSVELVFEAIARPELERLLRSNPPTKQQVAEYQAESRALGRPVSEIPTYDGERFPPALLAACAVEPSMTVEEATQLWESDAFSRGELGLLWTQVWTLNNGIKQ